MREKPGADIGAPRSDRAAALTTSGSVRMTGKAPDRVGMPRPDSAMATLASDCPVARWGAQSTKNKFTAICESNDEEFEIILFVLFVRV